MKLLLAMMKHEANTFSDVPTPFSRFHADGQLPEHDAAIEFHKWCCDSAHPVLAVEQAGGEDDAG